MHCIGVRFSAEYVSATSLQRAGSEIRQTETINSSIEHLCESFDLAMRGLLQIGRSSRLVFLLI
jgi:hypothetical protein